MFTMVGDDGEETATGGERLTGGGDLSLPTLGSTVASAAEDGGVCCGSILGMVGVMFLGTATSSLSSSEEPNSVWPATSRCDMAAVTKERFKEEASLAVSFTWCGSSFLMPCSLSPLSLSKCSEALLLPLLVAKERERGNGKSPLCKGVEVAVVLVLGGSVLAVVTVSLDETVSAVGAADAVAGLLRLVVSMVFVATNRGDAEH